MLHGEGISGAIFLALYTINLSILIYGYTTRRIVFKSVFTFLLIHVLLRLSAQSISIAIGTKPTLDFGLLIAFFVLGAEGYFSLVLCAYRFLIHHHQHTYRTAGSWLEGKPVKNESGKDDPWYKRLRRSLTARDRSGNKDPWVMTWIHWIMIAANTIIIVGGTRTNGSNVDEADYYDNLKIANALRIAGQALFLVINLFLFNFLVLSRNQDRSPTGTLPLKWTKFFRVSSNHGEADTLSGQRRLDGYEGSTHPMLRVLFFAWPPLIIRGLFGVLQAAVPAINYANPDSYAYDITTGNLTFSNTFIICESLLAVLPEWTACCLLCTCMFTRETFDPKKVHAGTNEAAESKAGRVASGEDGQTYEPTLIDTRQSVAKA